MIFFKQVIAKNPQPIRKESFDIIDCTSITWLAGAGFLINCRGTVIFIDPVLMTEQGNPGVSEIGMKLKVAYPISADSVPKADYVLYTHSDIDHMGPMTAKALARLKPMFIGPHPVYYKLTKFGIDPQLVEVCREGDPFNIGQVVVEVTPADHPWQLQDPAKCGKPFRKGDCCGFILNTPDGRIYFPGDTRIMEEHLKIKDIDVLALDVSMCAYHLNHPAAILLANNNPDALIIPLHYGTYDKPDKGAHSGDPLDVFAHISNAANRALLPAPGEHIFIRNGKRI
ncbi:MAG TPA: MBL fold metallo-hydrolase [Bacillota bacterium]|nr:MBL fold metallo-hydrolase [Bacillota bacterium]